MSTSVNIVGIFVLVAGFLLAACPTDALYKDESTGAILVHAQACIGCAACVDACPFGVASLHPETGLPLICDLCHGDPACVKRCATGALVYADAQSELGAKREKLTITPVDASIDG